MRKCTEISKKPAPNSVETLALYRSFVGLTSDFKPLAQDPAEVKEVLQKAVRELFDVSAERRLDLHLETFLKYIAKSEAELFQLLQLTAFSCSAVSLTDVALLTADAAYQAALPEIEIDRSPPDEVFKLPRNGKLQIYRDLHRTSDAHATICLTGSNYLPSASNYRSFRIHARAGPRMRRDCELAYAKVQLSPWAIATRGYFLPFRYVIHCRSPFIDSEASISQRMQLRDAYLSAFELAQALGVKSIEVPLISVQGSRSTLEKVQRTTVEAIHAAQKCEAGFDKICLIGCAPRDEPR